MAHKEDFFYDLYKSAQCISEVTPSLIFVQLRMNFARSRDSM